VGGYWRSGVRVRGLNGLPVQMTSTFEAQAMDSLLR
jgi:hypothetical protein